MPSQQPEERTSPIPSESPQSLQPGSAQTRALRARLNWRGELLLALAPTIVVLLVLALVQAFSKQQVLFASLASSAFLIYLDPGHGTNRVRTLLLSQGTAALLGFGTFWILGPGYSASAIAITTTIFVMIAFDAVHPPAVSTALSFAFRASNDTNLALFVLALFIVVLLVALQRFSLYFLAKLTPRFGAQHQSPTKPQNA